MKSLKEYIAESMVTESMVTESISIDLNSRDLKDFKSILDWMRRNHWTYDIPGNGGYKRHFYHDYNGQTLLLTIACNRMTDGEGYQTDNDNDGYLEFSVSECELNTRKDKVRKIGKDILLCSVQMADEKLDWEKCKVEDTQLTKELLGTASLNIKSADDLISHLHKFLDTVGWNDWKVDDVWMR